MQAQRAQALIQRHHPPARPDVLQKAQHGGDGGAGRAGPGQPVPQRHHRGDGQLPQGLHLLRQFLPAPGEGTGPGGAADAMGAGVVFQLEGLLRLKR